MTGVAAMLALCAITIQLLMRLNADGHDRLRAAASLERMAQQLRQDAHASESAEFDAKAAAERGSLRLTLDPKHDIFYEPHHGAVVRIETKDGKPSRRESYSLPRGGVSRFGFRDEGKRRLILLVVTHESGKNPTEPARPLEVAALLGKDRVGPLGHSGGEKP
jgi:hypothetical protein